MSNMLPSRPDPSYTEELAPFAPAGPPSVQPYDMPPPSDEEPGFNWRRYVGAVWRYKWLALLVVVLGAAVGIGVTNMIPPQYQAQSTVWVEPQTGGSQGPIRPAGLLQSRAWVELLKTFAVLDPVVMEQQLYLSPGEGADSVLFRGFSVISDLRPGAYRLEVEGSNFTLLTEDGDVVDRGRVGGPVGRNIGLDWTPPAAALTPGRSVEFAVVSPRESAIALQNNLLIQIDENANFLKIGLMGGNPARVTSTVNAVAAQFVQVAAEQKRAQLDTLTQILEEQTDYAGTNLQDAEMALEQFRVQTITEPSDRVTPAPAGLAVTQDPVISSYFQMQIQQDAIQQDRQAIQRALSGRSGIATEALEVIPSVQQSSELQQALAELTTRRAELRALRSRYTDEHLPVRRLVDEIGTLEEQTIPQMTSGLLAQLSSREGAISGRIQSASGELREIPTRSIEEQRLERKHGATERLFTELQQRLEETRLAAASSIPDVRVLDEATVPYRPTNDEQKTRIILLSLLASFGLAVVSAIVLDRVDPNVRYPEQVTYGMGLNILGAVPHVAGPSGRLGTQNTAQVIEAFREIRLSMAHAHGIVGPTVVIITSPGMGDGKSFVSSNLALAFADQGHRTLLIDGDIRRGGLHRLFDVTRIPGLTNYLAGRAPREQILHKTAYPNLDLIGCGSRMKGGPELLGSPAMSKLLMEMRSQYSVILIDSPPLGAGVDPFALGTLAGNVLLVLRTGNTNRELASAKLDLMDRLPIRVLGAVLNDVPAHGVYRYYSYIAGYESQDEVLADGSTGAKQLQRV